MSVNVTKVHETQKNAFKINREAVDGLINKLPSTKTFFNHFTPSMAIKSLRLKGRGLTERIKTE